MSGIDDVIKGLYLQGRDIRDEKWRSFEAALAEVRQTLQSDARFVRNFGHLASDSRPLDQEPDGAEAMAGRFAPPPSPGPPPIPLEEWLDDQDVGPAAPEGYDAFHTSAQAAYDRLNGRIGSLPGQSAEPPIDPRLAAWEDAVGRKHPGRGGKR